ncbi:restriction endonuclease subunit S [Phocaeicola sp. KGMB11183]|uniref:Restriction endonuclease subunit S n=1 Tax=Phocaeicola acetigenes TaxID=3016083 RepID=A0ABT4PDQ3_9BACT|nr:restriction endonuclease subunit S [Phocaeicola sp. KGMB11183]MCZ8371163.1 restriction endonuclease subunit S [Phocaeicola sp. KGMB11183]
MENRYDKYKDSGIAWIGEIPEHWEVIKIKQLLKNNSLKVGPFGSQLSGSDILSDGKYWIYNQRTVLDNNFSSCNSFITHEKYNDLIGFKVNAGDILLTTRGTIGKISRVPTTFNEGVIHPCIIRFNINESILKYDILKYIFNDSDLVINQVKYNSNSTTIDVIYSDTLKNIILTCIPKEEQQSIATYLDQKCSEIDELITLQEEMITKLQSYKQSVITEAVTKGLDKNIPLKDSGIEWIGEIPEHWEIRTLKTMLSGIQDGTHGTFKNVISDYLLLSAKNITDNGLQFSDIERTISENDYKTIISNGYPQKGDILLCCVGTIGRCCIYNYDRIYAFQRSVSFLRTNKNTSNRFLLYLLRSQICTTQFLMSARTSAQSGIYLSTLSSLIIITPPLPEQQSIADYLDQKCSEIDALISIKQQKIEKLKDYKKSLIFECVTGKRKVS